MLISGVLVLLKLTILLFVVREVGGQRTCFQRAMWWLLHKAGQCIVWCVFQKQDLGALHSVSLLLMKYTQGSIYENNELSSQWSGQHTTLPHLPTQHTGWTLCSRTWSPGCV